jgi:tetratricopeptide (TPR) repeat protein
MLAYHFSKGGDAERAETYLFRAGDEAAQAAASSEALHFFEEASRLYLESDGKGRDPRKQIELESKIAAALYYRGRFVEAIEHYDRALECLGDRGPKSRFGAFLRAGVDLISILARLYLPLHPRPRPASDDERQIMELRYARAEATVTAEPTQHVLNGLGTLARLQRLEPQSVPRSGRMYAGAVGLFAYGGISFPVSRRLSAVAREVAARQGEDDQLYEHVMRFASTVFEGDYAEEHEIPVERLEASLDAGQPWGPTTYLGLLGEKQVRRGDFAGTHRSMDELARIWDLFQYDLAKANFHNLEMLLPLEQRRLEEASEAAVRYYDEHPEDLLHLIALSGRAKAETLLGRLDAAQETVRHAGELLARCQPAPPFHTTTYLASALRLDLARLRSGARPGRRRMRAPLGRARAALRSAAKVAWWQPEVLRVAAACALESSSRRQRRLGWLWLERSLAVSERLGARVDLARGQALAVRAARAEPSPRRIVPDWAAGDACAERAVAAFEALDLRQDLERLRSLRKEELPVGP